MEEQSRHRHHALEALSRYSSRPRSSTATGSHSIPSSGHSIWSDDAASTQRVNFPGGIDSRFNHVDLGDAPPSVQTPNSRIPRPISVHLTNPNGGGAEVIWSTNDADAESQYSTETAMEPQSRMKRLSKALSKHLTVWQKLKGEGKPRVGWIASAKALAKFSWLNVLLIFVPIAWGVHGTHVSHMIKFLLCFIAIMPLSKILDYGGEQLALYCGRALGDLIVITLNNAVETALAIILLAKCELKLLQSTVIGVVLLRLLLVPGTSFLTGGAWVMSQDLHPHVVSLNNALLTVGALTLLLPAAYFAGLDRLVPLGSVDVAAAISDTVRGDFLKLSRALALFLLAIYIGSRFYLHDPPGESDDLHEHPDAPASFKADIAKLEKEDPQLHPVFCVLVLVISVVLLAFTSEFLVSSVNPMRKILGIHQEWFGIVLLPLVSYSADGILTTAYFLHRHLRKYHGRPPPTVTELAQGRSIDLGIQFLLFWLPILVLFAWFTHKPLSILFDVFEVAVLLGACFLVNHVTSDSKTNWVEGFMMVTLYIMVAITAWFYPGQTDIQYMLSCMSVEATLHSPPSFLASTLDDEGQHTHSNKTSPVVLAAHTGAEHDTLDEKLQNLIKEHGVVRTEHWE